jgi:hypothetical protein
MKKQIVGEGSVAAEGKQPRNKATISATVSPWLKRKLEAAVEKGDDFASLSDLVSLACQEFLLRHFPDSKDSRTVDEKAKSK